MLVEVADAELEVVGVLSCEAKVCFDVFFFHSFKRFHFWVGQQDQKFGLGRSAFMVISFAFSEGIVSFAWYIV